MARAARRWPYRWTVVLGLLFLVTVIDFADRAVLGVVAPQLVEEFGLTASELGLIGSAFGFGYVSVQVFASGAMVRKLTAYGAVILCALLWSGFLALTTAASSVAMFFIARLLFGAAEGAFFPAMEGLASRWFRRDEMQRAFNYAWAGIPIGSLVGVPIAVWTAELLGWRGPFWVLGGVGLVLALLCVMFLADGPERSRFVSKAELEEVVANRSSKAHVGRVYRWGDVLRSKAIWLAAVCSLSNAYIIFMMLTFFPLYMTTVRGVPFRDTAWMVALPYLAAAFGGVLMSSLSDKFFKAGRRYVSRTLIPGGMAVVAGIAFLCAVLSPDIRIAIALFCVSGFAQQASNGVVNGTAIDICPAEPHLATQVISGIGASASIFAPLITGALIDAGGGSYLPAFTVASFFPVVVGIVVLLFFRPKEVARTEPLEVSQTGP